MAGGQVGRGRLSNYRGKCQLWDQVQRATTAI